ncbi:MAG: LytTR family transcriptional regulator [Clostridium sp.]|nr:LytTR family transcriptional regulator [Clostridium sp.]
MKVTICGNSSEDRVRIRELLEEYQQKNGQTIEIQECSETTPPKYPGQTALSFPFVGGEHLLDVSDILYIETDRHQNIFHTPHASYRLYQKLDEIEKRLAPYGFVRAHRSFLVNMRYIRKISSYVLKLSMTAEPGDHLAENADGQSFVEISVPKSRYAHVKKAYADYLKTNG